MSKFESSHYQYTLLMRNASEQRINGMVSRRDLDATRKLARAVLRTGRYAFVDIYTHGASVEEMEASEPLLRVSLDSEEETTG